MVPQGHYGTYINKVQYWIFHEADKKNAEKLRDGLCKTILCKLSETRWCIWKTKKIGFFGWVASSKKPAIIKNATKFGANIFGFYIFNDKGTVNTHNKFNFIVYNVWIQYFLCYPWKPSK